MSDVLRRRSGLLPNLGGICWLKAKVWLTRYWVVLCKQDNGAGKLTEPVRPLVPCLYLFLLPVQWLLNYPWLYHLCIISCSCLVFSYCCCRVKTWLTANYVEFCILTSIKGLLPPQFKNTLTLCTSGSFKAPWIMSDVHCHPVKSWQFGRGKFSPIGNNTDSHLSVERGKLCKYRIEVVLFYNWYNKAVCSGEYKTDSKCERTCVNISPFSIRWCHLNSSSKHLIIVFKKEPSCDSLDNDRQLQRHFATKLSQVDG